MAVDERQRRDASVFHLILAGADDVLDLLTYVQFNAGGGQLPGGDGAGRIVNVLLRQAREVARKRQVHGAHSSGSDPVIVRLIDFFQPGKYLTAFPNAAGFP